MKKTAAVMLIIAMLSCFACTKQAVPNDTAAATEAPTEVQTEAPAEPTAEAQTEAPTPEPTEVPSSLNCYCYIDSSNGGSNAYSGSVGEKPEELMLWEKALEIPPENDLGREMTVEFDGVTYSGEYRSWGYIYRSSFTVDRYWYDDGEFMLNSSTGELVCISPMLDSYIDAENLKPDLDDPRTETEAAALEFSSRLLNIEGYELETVDIRQPADGYAGWQEFDLYFYTFVKKALGESTMDRFEIQVTSKGTITFWRLFDIGAFDPLPEDMSRFEGVDLDAMIEAKVNECLNRDDIGYEDLEIRNRYFCISPVDGSTVMYVRIKMPKDITGGSTSRSIYIIIK